MYKLNNNSKNNEQGVVLLIALMILTVMMVSVLALSQVIVGEIKSTLYADRSIYAFYAADSGIENGLYELKRARDTDNFDDFYNLETVFLDIDPPNPAPFDNGQVYTFSLATTTDNNFTTNDLNTSSLAYLDLIEPGGGIASISGQFNCYKVEWSIDSCFPSHTSDQLEITYVSLEENFANSTTTKHVAVCGCSIAGDQCNTINRTDIDPNKYYRFSFRPLDGAVASTTFYGYDDVSNCGTGTPKVPSDARMTVTGYYRGTTYSVSAQLPVYSPLSDVFSYVIFSEEEILKGF